MSTFSTRTPESVSPCSLARPLSTVPSSPLAPRMLKRMPLLPALCLGLCLSLGLTGCIANTAATNYYILDSGLTTPNLSADRGDARPRLQLRRVDVPGYLDRNAIVTRDGSGVRLNLAEFHNWAEPLTGGMQRVLSEVLTPQLLELGVLLQPLDDDSRGPQQIFVQVQRFDGTLGGEVVLDARWTLRDSDDKTVARGAFVQKENAGASYDSLVEAQSLLLRKLGQSMVEPIGKAVKK